MKTYKNVNAAPSAAEVMAEVLNTGKTRRIELIGEQYNHFVLEFATLGGEFVMPTAQSGDNDISALLVPDVSQIERLYMVTVYSRADGICELNTQAVMPMLAIGDRIYYAGARWDKPGAPRKLKLYNSITQAIPYSVGWKYDAEPAPQKVGKATAKKLQAWVSWLDKQEAAAAEYINRGNAELNALIDRLNESGVEWVRDGDTIHIYNGVLRMEVKIKTGGLSYGYPEVDYRRLYSATRECHDTQNDYLAFMLAGANRRYKRDRNTIYNFQIIHK